MEHPKHYIRIAKFPWKIIENNAVIIDSEENRALNLTEVGAEIWGYLDKPKTLDEIVENICQKFEVRKNKAHKDAMKFLKLLLKEELIQDSE